MASIHGPKKPGAARAGVWATSLLLALLLLLPAAWYARYRDQLAAPSVPAGSGAALVFRPSGVMTLGPPAPGQARTVQIRHTGGQVITTVTTGGLMIAAKTSDPHPPSYLLDVLGQSLCDRYNAWTCERGDPHQSIGTIQMSGDIVFTGHIYSQPGISTGIASLLPSISSPAPPPAHAPGIPAPAPSLHSAARTPARP